MLLGQRPLETPSAHTSSPSSSAQDRLGSCQPRVDRSSAGPSRWGTTSGRRGRTVQTKSVSWFAKLPSRGRCHLLVTYWSTAYLSAGLEVLTLGEDAFVIVDVVLPAVLGPGHRNVSLLFSFCSYMFHDIAPGNAGVRSPL